MIRLIITTAFLMAAGEAAGSLERPRPEIFPLPKEQMHLSRLIDCSEAKIIRWWVRQKDGRLKIVGQLVYKRC